MLKVAPSKSHNPLPVEFFTRACRNAFNKISKIADSIISSPRSNTAQFSSKIQLTRSSNNYPISKICLLAISALWATRCGVQAQSTFFQTLGGIGDDFIHDLIGTADGGFIMAGPTNSFSAGNEDLFLSKSRSDGTIDWVNVLETDSGYTFALKFTSDGDIIVSGSTITFGAGNADLFISRWKTNGTLAWARTLGGAGFDFANTITISDEEMFVSGITNSFGAGDYDVLLSKWGTNGTFTWVKTFGGIGEDSVSDMMKTSDGGVIMAGSTTSFGSGDYDAILIKWLPNGDLEWAKTLGGAGIEYGRALAMASNEEVILGGLTNSFSAGDYEVLLAKWWMNGTLAWARTFGKTGSDHVYTLMTTSDGGIIGGGLTTGFSAGNDDALVAKWWTNGTLAWAKALIRAGSEYVIALTTTSDGKIVGGGQTNSFGTGDFDFLLAKMTSDGEISNCSYLQNVSLNASDLTSTIAVEVVNTSPQSWGSRILNDWNNPTINTFTPNLIQQCLPTTTGVATTGQATTGVVTTGVATTGTATTGVATTGIATTGQATTGIVTTGVATTGIATTGVATTGIATTGQATTGVATTGIATTGTITTAPSSRDRQESSSTSPDTTPLVVGISVGGALLGVGIGSGIGLGVLGLVLKRRKQNQANSAELGYVSSMPAAGTNYGTTYASTYADPTPYVAPTPPPSYGVTAAYLKPAETAAEPENLYGVATLPRTESSALATSDGSSNTYMHAPSRVGEDSAGSLKSDQE